MRKPIFCCECAARAPDAETSYTVIGAGWRISKRETPDGLVVEWRCRACWRKHKGGSGHPSSGGFKAAPGPNARIRTSGNN